MAFSIISPAVLFAHLTSSFFFLSSLSVQANEVSEPINSADLTAPAFQDTLPLTEDKGSLSPNKLFLLKPANLHGAAEEKLHLCAFEGGHKTTSTIFYKAHAVIPTPRREDKEQIGTAWNIVSEKLAPSTPSSRGLWEEEKLWVFKNINFLVIITLNVALKFTMIVLPFARVWVLWAGFNLNQ